MNKRMVITVTGASLMFFGVCAASLIGLFWGLANLVNLGQTGVMVAELVALAITLYLSFRFAVMAWRAEKSLLGSTVQAG